MGYTYDSSTDEVKHGGSKVGWASTAVVATSLIVLLVAVLSGGSPGLLTTFSSIPEPPAGVTWWDKELLRDNYPIAWGSTTVVTTGTTLQVADVITSTVPYTLVETWDDNILQLTGFITTTGTAVTSTDTLTWAATTSGSLVKAWNVLTHTFVTTHITETLQTASGSTQVVIVLQPGSPPATPTPTPTVYVTPTPRYTPRPWPTVMYPTATPCVGLGCTPLNPSDNVPYAIYLPLVMRNSGAPPIWWPTIMP